MSNIYSQKICNIKIIDIIKTVSEYLLQIVSIDKEIDKLSKEEIEEHKKISEKYKKIKEPLEIQKKNYVNDLENYRKKFKKECDCINGIDIKGNCIICNKLKHSHVYKSIHS